MGPNADAAAIRHAIEAVLRAFAARDANAVAASYAPDAVIFDLAPPLSRPVDAAEIAAWIATWRGPVVRTVRELGLDVSGDLAVWHGFIHTDTTTTERRARRVVGAGDPGLSPLGRGLARCPGAHLRTVPDGRQLHRRDRPDAVGGNVSELDLHQGERRVARPVMAGCGRP